MKVRQQLFLRTLLFPALTGVPHADVLTRVNVWQLEGEQHQSLLRFALNEENFHKTAVLIVLDFSKPWNLAQTLTAWFELLATHIKGLRLTSKFVEPSRNKCRPHPCSLSTLVLTA